MTSALARLLVLAALLATPLVALAGAPAGPSCCVCSCQFLPTQCTSVSSPAACAAVLADCNNLNPAICEGGVITNGTCAEVSACPAAASAAPAPSLDATGLAIGIIVLGGLAALRLRRPARQPQKSPPRPPRPRDQRERD
jgi:hypothetical protein